MVERYAYLDDDQLRTRMGTFDVAMPELPETLRQLVSVEVGRHPGHQAPGEAPSATQEALLESTLSGAWLSGRVLSSHDARNPLFKIQNVLQTPRRPAF